MLTAEKHEHDLTVLICLQYNPSPQCLVSFRYELQADFDKISGISLRKFFALSCAFSG